MIRTRRRKKAIKTTPKHTAKKLIEKKPIAFLIKRIQPISIPKRKAKSKELPKIVCVMAIHRREAITKITIKRLKEQSFKMDIVVVGDSEIEERIAEEAKVHYVYQKNTPLGRKTQTGVAFARQFDPDGIMICGSDDWLTNNWCDVCKDYIDEYDLVGKADWFMCNVVPNKPIGKIIKRGYANIYIDVIKGSLRENMAVGSGRFISKNVLDKLDWKLFDEKRNTSLDTFSTNRIQTVGGRIKILNYIDSIKVIAIKGPWETKSAYNALKDSKKLKIYPDIEDSKDWLENYFPGSLVDIKSIVPEVIV